MKKELLNGSGAKDTTAYKAIKNAEPVTVGEVRKYSNKTFFLVVNGSQNGMYCPVLRVSKEKPFDLEQNPDRWTEITFEDGSVGYTDVSMLTYLSMSFLTGCGKRLSILDDATISNLKDRIADSIGIRVVVKQISRSSISDGTYKKLYEDLLDRLIKNGGHKDGGTVQNRG